MTVHSSKEAVEYILNLTSEECDYIALNKGSMSIKVDALQPPRDITRGRTIDGWSLFWIPLSKTPAMWQLVLGADSTRTHTLAIEGRVRRLVNDYGFDRTEAERYTEAARGIQYGFTDTVICMVRDSESHRTAWERFPGPSAAIRFWLSAYPAYKTVNHGKIVAANKMIKSLWGKPEVTSSGIHTLKVYNDRHDHQLPLPPRAVNTLVAAWS